MYSEVQQDLPDLKPNNMHHVVLYNTTFDSSAFSKGHANKSHKVGHQINELKRLFASLSQGLLYLAFIDLSV